MLSSAHPGPAYQENEGEGGGEIERVERERESMCVFKSVFVQQCVRVYVSVVLFVCL